MECLVCGRPIPSLDEDGICTECGDKKISEVLCSAGLGHSLTRRELHALRSELDDLVNE